MGGWKHSGIGYRHGEVGIRKFCRSESIARALASHSRSASPVVPVQPATAGHRQAAIPAAERPRPPQPARNRQEPLVPRPLSAGPVAAAVVALWVGGWREGGAGAPGRAHPRTGGEAGQPVHLAQPEGDERLYAVSARGSSERSQPRGRSPKPFLDLRDRVSNEGEGGLLSIAFPPDHERTGLLYVCYAGRDHSIPWTSTAERGTMRPLIRAAVAGSSPSPIQTWSTGEGWRYSARTAASTQAPVTAARHIRSRRRPRIPTASSARSSGSTLRTGGRPRRS